MASGFAFGCAKDTVEFFNAGIGEVRFPVGEGFLLVIFYVGPCLAMMLTHCGNNVRNRYSGCVFSVKDIVPVPLKTSRNQKRVHSIKF